MDAVLIGSVVYGVGFSHIPTLAFLTIGLANGMPLGGVRFMLLSAATINLLWALLPSAISAELDRGRTVEPRRHEHATLLLADIVDFSRLAAASSPSRLLPEVNHVFRGFDRIAQRHGLEPLRTMVDVYLAGSGVPRERAAHAHDALRAAEEMLDFADHHNGSRARPSASRPARRPNAISTRTPGIAPGRFRTTTI